MPIDKEISRYNLAISKGIRWLEHVRNINGSYGENVNTLEAYYKSPLAFTEANKRDEGQKILDWIEWKYLTAEGHFHDPNPSEMSDRYCDLYQDLWILWGAYRLHQRTLVDKIRKFILRFFDKNSGGFQSNILDNPLTAPLELRSTAFSGIVCLMIGDVEIAQAAGDFVINMLDLQPDLSLGFFIVRDRNGKIVDHFTSEKERFYIISTKQTRPLYYALGLSLALLAKLYQYTNELKYLIAAERYLNICKSYGSQIFHHDYSGKLGWGLAMLYHSTQDDEYLNLSTTIADYLLGLQLPSGEWFLRNLYNNREEQPLVLTLDRTAEYIVWFTNIAKEVI